MKPKLVFVYNADSGLFNTVTDIAHKILSPGTYSCQLCALTHSYFSVREEWVSFLQELDAECAFLHRDELTKQYGVMETDLPIIYSLRDTLTPFMTRAEIDACKDLVSLKSAIASRLRGIKT